MKIKEAYWFSGMTGTIGIVVGEDQVTWKRKRYIGTAPGFNVELDTHHIAQTGSPVDPGTLTEIAEYLKGK